MSEVPFKLVDGVEIPLTPEEIAERNQVIEAAQTAEAEAALVAYKAQRAAEYPAIGDQLDALFHAGVFPEEMAALIQAVKDKYPKP